MARQCKRVLVMAPGPIGERMTGPEVRAFELARALAADHTVTVAAAGDHPRIRDGIRIVGAGRATVLGEALRHDVVVSACLPPYLLALAAIRPLLTITDQYDPHELELATLGAGRTRRWALRTRSAVQALQLGHADLVLCASDAQREALMATAAGLPGRPAIDPLVIPFGVPDPPPVSTAHPLRERFAQLAPDDVVVLWWGSVWRWLDADTVVRAFARIARERDDVKLVITAGRPPNAGGERFDAAASTEQLSASLGLTDTTVFFLRDWIPYEGRHDYLSDADLGITLARDGDEARLAARARYMDYLTGGLPCVLSAGDDTAAQFAAEGFATLVQRPAPDELAAVLLSLAGDPDRRAAAVAAGRDLARRSSWRAVGAQLRGAVDAAARPHPRPRRAPSVLGGAGAYYLLRIGERLTGA